MTKKKWKWQNNGLAKSSFRFFCEMFWKNPNKLLATQYKFTKNRRSNLRKPIKEGASKKLIEGGKNNLKYSVNPRIERKIILNMQDKQKTNKNNVIIFKCQLTILQLKIRNLSD